MRDARYFREQARRCRELLRAAIEPGLIEQLRLWSVELTDEADDIMQRASSARKTPPRSSPVRVPRSPRSRSSSALPSLRPVASNPGPVKRTSRPAVERPISISKHF